MKEKEIKIIHVMADGTVRDSVAGLKVPADCEVYKVLREISQKRKKCAS